SPAVLKRVAEVLFNGEAHIVRSESDRPNIRYYVKHTCAKKQEALMLARGEQRPMIIFCGTRAHAEDMARELTVCYGRDAARFYHAGLEKKEKDEIEKWFFDSTDGVLCATCAYGMGVDKHDIHTVVHLDAPETAEAYIQEAGRAGRDGAPSKAILLWSPEDSARFASSAEDGRKYEMKRFAETTDCRRQVLLDALGAEQAVCSGCDLCDARREIQQKKKCRTGKIESSENFVLRFISRHKKRYSKIELEGVLLPMLNEKSRAVCGRSIWEHSGIADMLRQLEKAERIRICAWPWKNKVTAAQKITLQKRDRHRALRKNRPLYSLHSRLMRIRFRRLPLLTREQQEQA
ncbi:MAG TPA: hypothetical protein DCL73_15095, partial [Treponema sp.]|nr:hypothetical protein [Treponema sp.]